MSTAYDPRNHTWDSWAALMCEAYAAQNLSTPESEMQWREWAEGFVGIDLFAKDAMPSPHVFTEWRDWAIAVMSVLSPSGG